jgi:5-(hydroxymethyl)furfural/furfural oxidase
MGRRGDPRAVVDSDGRVFGIAGLRVVDASIFPTVPRGYTHFVVLMVAEKIADAVKAAWREASSNSPTPMHTR